MGKQKFWTPWVFGISKIEGHTRRNSHFEIASDFVLFSKELSFMNLSIMFMQLWRISTFIYCL